MTRQVTILRIILVMIVKMLIEMFIMVIFWLISIVKTHIIVIRLIVITQPEEEIFSFYYFSIPPVHNKPVR